MTVLTEGRHAGEAILSEANFHRSRDTVTIPAGTGAVKANTILGELTATPGTYVPSPNSEIIKIKGAETATAMTIHEVDATTSAARVAVLTRDAEIKAPCVEYHATVDDDAKKTAKLKQLKAVGIIAR